MQKQHTYAMALDFGEEVKAPTEAEAYKIFWELIEKKVKDKTLKEQIEIEEDTDEED